MLRSVEIHEPSTLFEVEAQEYEVVSSDLGAAKGRAKATSAGLDLNSPTIRRVAIYARSASGRQPKPKEPCGYRFTNIADEISIESKPQLGFSVMLPKAVSRSQEIENFLRQ